jgi:acetylglutamate kinase
MDCTFIPMNNICVYKVSGSDLDDPIFTQRFAQCVGAARANGETPIVIHGGGKELTQLLNLLNIETRFVDGLRVTDERSRDTALMVFCGLANKRLVAAFLNAGVNAVGLSGVDGGLVRVERLNASLGFVGKPVRVNTDLLNHLLNHSSIPIIAPICVGVDGEMYNVNADHVAGAVAAAMNADMLTFVTNVPAVLDKNKSPVAHLLTSQVEQLIDDGTISGGMIPKVRTCLQALQAGVSKVRITNLEGVADNTGTLFEA